MKIKLAILEKDVNYLNRIVAVFNTKFADNFEVYSFTDQAVALATLESSKIDVLLASDAFEISVKNLPRRCSFAYFVDSMDVDTVNGQTAICKFQRIDLIYKQILSIYSEKSVTVSGLRMEDGSVKTIIFSSPCGGAGTSTMAVSCATHFASKGKKTLYLCLEKFGMSDVFFSAEGQFGMSDIIYALKSKKANLPMKLESCVKRADNGVYFFAGSKLALDMFELTQEDITRLIAELTISGSYDYVIVDIDFSLSREAIQLYKKAHALVWVGDGTETSNLKIQRAFSAVCVLEQNADAPLMNRLGMIYNKFSNKTGQAVGDIGIRNIGGAPRYEHASAAQIIGQLSSMEMFDKII